jgi:hypothetical protein
MFAMNEKGDRKELERRLEQAKRGPPCSPIPSPQSAS